MNNQKNDNQEPQQGTEQLEASAEGQKALKMRRQDICFIVSWVALLWLASLAYVVISHRNTITRTSSEMIGLYLAVPAVFIMLMIALKRTVTRLDIFLGLCGLAGLVASGILFLTPKLGDISWADKILCTVEGFVVGVAVSGILAWFIIFRKTKRATKTIFWGLYALVLAATAGIPLFYFLAQKTAGVDWTSGKIIHILTYMSIGLFIGWAWIWVAIKKIRPWIKKSLLILYGLVLMAAAGIPLVCFSIQRIGKGDIDWTSGEMVRMYIVGGIVFISILAIWNIFVKTFLPVGKGEKLVRSYSDFMFLFPIVLIGLLGPISDLGWLHPETCAWIGVCLAIYCLCALPKEFGKILMGFLGVMLLVVFPLANYTLKSKYAIDILGNLHIFLADLDIMYEESLRKAAFIFSVGSGIIIPFTILWTHMDKTHKVASLSLRRFRLFAGTQTLVSESRNVDARYPNLWKFLPFMIGDVVIQDPTNRLELYRIRNVCFLPFRIGKIRRLLRTIPIRDVSSELS